MLLPPLSLALAPSEIVLLHGDHFAQPPGAFTPKHDLLNGKGAASRDPLAETLLCAAFLGLERDGVLRLEHTRKKALFGLLKPHAVFAEATDHSASPVGRVEADLAAVVRRARQPIEVDEVIYQWLATDRSSPHAAVLYEATAGLVDRELVAERREKKKALLVLSYEDVSHELSENGHGAIAAADPAPIQRLLDEAEGRGELGRRLLAEVRQGLARRTEADRDASDWND